jgi:two-component system, sensor histidine kinase LadS
MNTRKMKLDLTKILFSILLISSPLYSQSEIIEWQTKLNGLDVSPYIEYYLDPTNELSSDIAYLKFPKDGFTQNSDKVINFPASKGTLWLRLNIHNPHDRPIQLILKCRYPLLENINLHYFQRGSFITKKHGRLTNPMHAEVKYRGSAFRIRVEPGDTSRILLSVQSNSSMNVPLNLYSHTGFYESVAIEQTFQGMYFGGLLVMLIYNIFMYVSLRDKSYLHYIVYLFFTGIVFQLFFNGYIHLLVLPELSFYTVYFHNLSYLISIAAFFPFAKSLLNLKHQTPKLNRILNVILISLFSLIPMYYFVSYSLMNKILDGFAAFVLLFFTFITFKLILRRYTPAYYFFAGFILVEIGGLTTMLKYNGFFPSNFITENSFQIAQYFEVILMSFALADRIRLLKVQNSIIQLKSQIDNEKLLSFQNEMIIAKKLQESTLPLQNPKMKGLKITSKYNPMSYVGGDFYDFHILDEHTILVLIADVTGHGIPAAFEAAMLKVAFSVEKELVQEPADLLVTINQILKHSYNNQYLTASIIKIDLKKKKMKIANAGHPALILHRRTEDKINQYRPKGSLIGYFENLEIHELELPIQSMDRIILWTDGMTEGIQPKTNDPYGEERFLNSIQNQIDSDNESAANSILSDSIDWLDGENPTDDLTLVVIDID